MPLDKKPMPVPGKLICEFEYFKIYEFDGWDLWLEMSEGEGMTFSKAEFMGFLSGIWKRF